MFPISPVFSTDSVTSTIFPNADSICRFVLLPLLSISNAFMVDRQNLSLGSFLVLRNANYEACFPETLFVTSLSAEDDYKDDIPRGSFSPSISSNGSLD